MFSQLYVFTAIELGKTMALFGATSIILANLLGGSRFKRSFISWRIYWNYIGGNCIYCYSSDIKIQVTP